MFFGAEFQQDRAQHADAKGHDGWGIGQRAFLVEDMALGGVPAWAAMFDGPGDCKPVPALQDGMPLLDVLFGELEPVADFGGQFFRQVVLQELPDFRAEGVLFRGEVEIHRLLLIDSAVGARLPGLSPPVSLYGGDNGAISQKVNRKLTLTSTLICMAQSRPCACRSACSFTPSTNCSAWKPCARAACTFLMRSSKNNTSPESCGRRLAVMS